MSIVYCSFLFLFFEKFFVFFCFDLVIEATLVKDWNPKDKNPEKYFKDGSFHTELGFVVFPH